MVDVTVSDLSVRLQSPGDRLIASFTPYPFDNAAGMLRIGSFLTIMNVEREYGRRLVSAINRASTEADPDFREVGETEPVIVEAAP